MSLLSIGLSGVNAAQGALTTTAHNIANANVTGYNRQQVITSTQIPQFTGVGFFGQGTQIDTVKRVYSEFLDKQVMSADTTHAQLDTFNTEISQINNLLADSSVGLSSSLQGFFDSVQDVAANPSSVPSRQAMLSSSESLASRFQTLYQRFDEIRTGVESQISESVDSINALAKQLADLNNKIVTAQVAGPNVPANDLLDKRSTLLQELNRTVKVSTTTESDGSMSVFIGSGQALVVGATSYNLTTKPSLDDPARLAIGVQLNSGTSTTIPEDLLTGGTLGGLLSFRSTALDPAQNALGRIALGLTQTFNAQHKLGQDLNGNMGSNYFAVITPKVQNLPDAVTGIPPTATLNASVASVGGLTNDDYILSYDGTNYSLMRQADKSIAYSGAALPTNVDGISVSVASGTVAAGDRFLIQPTRFASNNVSVAITNTSLVAAGAPFSTAAASANSGTGTITQGAVVSLTGIAAAAPHVGAIKLTFDSTTNLLTMSGAVTGTLAYNPVTDAAGKTFTLASPNISFSIGGVPKTGDAFTIGSNDGGISDNRNAIALGNLQSVKTLVGGSATFSAAYGQMVSQVGSQARQAQVGVDAQETLLEQAQASQQSLSGVNLDEEASNLLRFQQAYQASARVMSTAQTLFNEILNIAR